MFLVNNHMSKTHCFCHSGMGQTDRRIAVSLNARCTFDCAAVGRGAVNNSQPLASIFSTWS